MSLQNAAKINSLNIPVLQQVTLKTQQIGGGVVGLVVLAPKEATLTITTWSISETTIVTMFNDIPNNTISPQNYHNS